MSDQLAQISSTLERFTAAWNANDSAALAAFFVDDAALINPFGQRADGRVAVAAMYGQYFGGMLRGSTTSITVVKVRSVGESAAFVDADQTVTAADGSPMMALHLAALMRRSGDTWLFVDGRPYVFATRPT